MCGITAINRAVGRTSIRRPDQMARLGAIAIEERGRDATGFAWTNADDESWYWKDATRASEIVHRAPLNPTMTTVIGHTRWKTQGSAQVNANNHPVVDDGIMLVHNGIIDNDWKLYRELGLDFIKKAEVDSQVIASLLSHLPVGHPTDVLEMLQGSAAVAWIATEQPGTLHLARVKERPMTLAWTRSGDLVMSSTPGTLEKMSVLSGVRFRKVREIEEGVYLRVIAGEIVEEKTFTVPEGYKAYVSGWTPGVTHTVKTVNSPKVETPSVTPSLTPSGITDSADDEPIWFDTTVEYLRYVYGQAQTDFLNGKVSDHTVNRCRIDYEEALALENNVTVIYDVDDGWDDWDRGKDRWDAIEKRAIKGDPMTDEEFDICRMTEEEYEEYLDLELDLSEDVRTARSTQQEADRVLAEWRTLVVYKKNRKTQLLSLPRGDWEYTDEGAY